MRRSFCGLIALLGLLSMPAIAAAEATAARWVQYAADGKLEARIAVAVPACPPITIDGYDRPMHERAAADDDFPLRICSAQIPEGAHRLAVLGETLPTAKAVPMRIAVFGDSGCRVLERRIQNCRDPAAWPFARIAALAAAKHPDLVIHLGDYLYRESPCPPDDSRCAGSPSGDNWPSWKADFFDPAAPLLHAAPWVIVRGNHEECARAGPGWSRLLGPAPFDAESPCTANERPYALGLGSLSLIVFDDANAPDREVPKDLVPVYRADFTAVAELARGPSWLVMHRPLRGFMRLQSGEIVGGNATMLATASALPLGIELLLSGHIHAFEALNYEGDLPPQLIVGTGGDMQSTAPTDLAGRAAGGVKVKSGSILPGFGFLLLTRERTGWLAEVFGASGARVRACRVAARQIICRKP
ncbi:MAG TPA: metallophosphoesterase [Stellaceae bacterium]|nr:metallophosphoesterase [Stellaceae bacterium]